MNRRRLITGLGTIGLTAAAGCSSSDDGSTSSSDADGSSDSSDDGSSGDSSSESEESNIEERIHEIGEVFTVGEGDRVIEYIVNDMKYADAVGSEYLSEEANGIFAVIELSLTNKSGESFTISSNNFSIIAGENNNVYDPSTEAAVSFDSDERFDTESLTFKQLDPNLSAEGAVIFDIPEDAKFAFRVEPAGFLDTSEPHFVSPGGG